jgi:hypothetical protein
MSWHVGKINLPIFPWYGAPELVSREGRRWSQATLRANLGTGGALLSNHFFEKGGKDERIKAE